MWKVGTTRSQKRNCPLPEGPDEGDEARGSDRVVDPGRGYTGGRNVDQGRGKHILKLMLNF